MHRFPPDKLIYNLLAMLLFGLIVAFYAHYFGRRVNPTRTEGKLNEVEILE